MDRILLNIMMWVLFVGGLFGGIVGMVLFFTGGTPLGYGVMGIGGGFWLIGSGLIILFRSKI